MVTKKLMESTLPEIYQRVLDEEALQVIDSSYTNRVSDILFEAVTRCLSAMKRKDKAISFIFEELNGIFLAGAVVQFHDGGDNAGDNWSYVWTFDKSDIPENSHEIRMTDIAAQQYFNSTSYTKYHLSVKDKCIVDLYVKFIKVLSQWLSDNASKDDVISLIHDGVFEARVTVEGESIIKSLEVSGELKTLIKDDAAIEK